MKTKTVSWNSEPVNIPGIAWNRYETEEAFQTFCADWLRKQYSRGEGDAYRWFHHSANERIGAKAGFIAKMMGQSKGFIDFVQPGLKLAIELKVQGREPSLEQIEWLGYFHRIGWHDEVIRTFERFRELVLLKVAASD